MTHYQSQEIRDTASGAIIASIGNSHRAPVAGEWIRVVSPRGRVGTYKVDRVVHVVHTQFSEGRDHPAGVEIYVTKEQS